MNTRQKGSVSEDIAFRYLCAKGYLPVANNVHFREGEIDLVMRDLSGRMVVFEVKSSSCGISLEMIDYKKLRRLRKLAIKFSYERNLWPLPAIDAICLEIGADHRLNKVHHFSNITQYED